jgi:hypothetical protein
MNVLCLRHLWWEKLFIIPLMMNLIYFKQTLGITVTYFAVVSNDYRFEVVEKHSLANDPEFPI